MTCLADQLSDLGSGPDPVSIGVEDGAHSRVERLGGVGTRWATPFALPLEDGQTMLCLPDGDPDLLLLAGVLPPSSVELHAPRLEVHDFLDEALYLAIRCRFVHEDKPVEVSENFDVWGRIACCAGEQ